MSFRRSNPSTNERFAGRHRREHWYRDNSIYFITARCCEKFPAFESDHAKLVFWDRFEHWTSHYEFIPDVTTLMNNHYHTLGYVKSAKHLGEMMRKVHGSIAKLVNDILPSRHVPFWRTGHDDYFDGCLRDAIQYRRTYPYVLMQAVRAGIVARPEEYAHTHVNCSLEEGLERAMRLNALMVGVPYKRYARGRRQRQ